VNNDAVALAAFKRVTKYQRAQIITLAFAFIFSTAACLTLSYVNYVWAPDCILFSTWYGKEKSGEAAQKEEKLAIANGTTDKEPALFARQSGIIDPNKKVLDLQVGDGGEKTTRFGKKKNCYLTQYGHAAAAACSFILCWFFVFFRPTKEAYLFKKKTAASKLVIPGIVFCLAFTICVFIAAVTLYLGMASWCNNINIQKNNEPYQRLGSCSKIKDYGVKWQQPVYVDYYSLLLVGQVFAWFSSFIWLASLIILSIRCYLHVDFPDYFFEHSALNNDGFHTDDNE